MKRLILLIACIIYATTAPAQNNDWLAGYGIEVNPFFGKVLKHNYIFPPVPKSSFALDINILKQTDGSKEWQVRRNYPLVGLGITYTDYGLDSVYGKCIGLYPVLEIPIVRGEKLEWTCRFGYGIGYVTKRFERQPSWDTVNNLIGTHVNNFTMFTTQLRYKVSNKMHINAGFNYSHISNGSFRLPNLGVNMYGGHIGLRYFPVTDDPPKVGNNPADLNKRWSFHLRAGFGLVEYAKPNGPQYPVYSATAYVGKRYSSRKNNRVFAGVDYSYFQSMYSFLRYNEISVGEEHEQSWEGVIFIGHEFVLGRTGIVAQLGVPFHHTAINKDKTIQKLGYSYYIWQNENYILKELSLNAFIKSNNLEASHLEFGIGAGL